ncbi:MAG: hypothetical protein ACOYBW_04050 [Fluviibacter phosphoraccumulans]
MRRFFRASIFVLVMCGSSLSFGQQAANQIPQMQFQGVYATGHKDFNIYKMFDPLEDVLCYIMMPTLASKTDTPAGQIIYDSNTIGALSCFKIYAAPLKTVATPSKKK